MWKEKRKINSESSPTAGSTVTSYSANDKRIGTKKVNELSLLQLDLKSSHTRESWASSKTLNFGIRILLAFKAEHMNEMRRTEE